MKLNSDGLQVTRDEATELLIHHLRLAAVFFECASESLDELQAELLRQCPIEDLQRPAMQAFIETIFKSYAEDAKRWP
jgi:hypothetical protein